MREDGKIEWGMWEKNRVSMINLEVLWMCEIF